MVQIDVRGGPGRSKGVPGAPGPPRPRKRPILSQIQTTPSANLPNYSTKRSPTASPNAGRALSKTVPCLRPGDDRLPRPFEGPQTSQRYKHPLAGRGGSAEFRAYSRVGAPGSSRGTPGSSLKDPPGRVRSTPGLLLKDLGAISRTTARRLPEGGLAEGGFGFG